MNLISEIARGVWLINPEIAKGLYPMLHRILLGDIHPIQDIDKFEPENPTYFVNISGNNSLILESPDQQESESLIMVTQVIGPVTKYNQLCGPMGMQEKAQLLKSADKLDQVKAHVIYIDSGGGEATAARLMADTIKSLTKPTFAFVEGMAASAAYWIASACSFVCASSPMDRIGSIGTYVSIADYRNYFKQQGIEVTTVYASKSKDKNKDFLEAIDGNTEKLQTLVDTFNDFFLSAVKQNRSDQLDTKSKWDTGEVFFAENATEIGLIDSIATLDNYLLEIHKTLKND